MEYTEKEIQILENIKNNNSKIKQRDLADIIGLSLGMTNSILKRLVKKGWLIIRKINNRNIRYAVTPQGMDEIARRSYRYFKRTIKNVVRYKELIAGLAGDIRTRGYDGVALVGHSDLDFIVEHACHTYGLEYVKNEEKFKGKLFYLYAESYIPENAAEANMEGKGFLQRALMVINK